jgi:hypothetical protein
MKTLLILLSIVCLVGQDAKQPTLSKDDLLPLIANKNQIEAARLESKTAESAKWQAIARVYELEKTQSNHDATALALAKQRADLVEKLRAKYKLPKEWNFDDTSLAFVAPAPAVSAKKTGDGPSAQ